MKKKIIITGGGTGGHIWPLITIAESLKKEFSLLYLGQKNGPEEEAAQENHLKFKGIKAAKLQGWAILNPATWLFQLVGFIQSCGIITRYQPDLILAKGGFVTFPVVLAGWLKGVQILLHESDSIIGRANRLLLPFCLRIMVAFPKNYYPFYLRRKMIRTGIPIRAEFKERPLPKDPTVLFMGGSQGSRYLNQMVKELAPRLLKRVKLIHICGRDNLKEMAKFRDSLGKKEQKRYRLFGFSTKVAQLIKDSSLIVSRAGATSLVEIAKIRRPVILIPFPYAASAHQLNNAQILKDKNATVLLLEKRTNSQRLGREINSLLRNGRRRSRLAENLNRFWAIDARGIMIQIIKSIL